MNLVKICTATGIMVGLGACGSSTLEPVTKTVGSDLSGITITDNGDGTWTLTQGGTLIDLVDSHVSNSGSFGRFANWVSNYVYVGETPSGSGYIYMVNSAVNELDFNAVHLQRIGTTEIPVSGSAEYTGYAAISVTFLAANEYFGIGDESSALESQVTFNVDFKQSTISGQTSNSADFFDQENRSSFDIAFAETAIVDGGFAGDTIATEYSNAGTYEGIFVGSNGEELIGTYSHQRGDIIAVRAIFFAAAPTP